MSIEFDFLLFTESIALIVVNVIYMVFLYKKYVKKEIIPIHLAIGYGFLVFGRHVNYLGFLIKDLSYLFSHITNITFIFALVFIYLHYQAISAKKNSNIINIIILILVTINTLISILLFQDLISKIFEVRVIWYVTLNIFGLISSYFVLKTCWKAHKLMKESATRLELIAIIIVLLSFALYLLYDETFIFVKNYVWIVGQSILIINYIIHKNYIFRLTFPVHDIYIINRAGLLVYHRHVSTRNIPDLDESKQTVISGTIKAISVVVSETLGSSAKLRLFDAEIYKMYFSEIKGREGIIIVIASGNNYYLQKSIKIFSNLISNDIIQHINQPIIDNPIIFKTLDDNLQKSFPYLVLIEENKELN